MDQPTDKQQQRLANLAKARARAAELREQLKQIPKAPSQKKSKLQIKIDNEIQRQQQQNETEQPPAEANEPPAETNESPSTTTDQPVFDGNAKTYEQSDYPSEKPKRQTTKETNRTQSASRSQLGRISKEDNPIQVVAEAAPRAPPLYRRENGLLFI